MKPRTLVLVAGCFALVTGLLILLVPKTVQTGNPVLGQMDGERAGSYSCGSALQYAFGHRPWADRDAETYTGTEFTTVSRVCPSRVGSNLIAGLLWVVAGLAIIGGRWYMLRRQDRQRLAQRSAVP